VRPGRKFLPYAREEPLPRPLAGSRLREGSLLRPVSRIRFGNVCVDWSNSLHGNDFLDAECDLTKDLPFADASFDSILLSDVLEHIPTPERLWREMARLLKPEGKLLLFV
jgi:SAM-dependent methyltransferase